MTKPLSRTELETKAVRLELKALDDTGIFEGYASVFGNEDLGADIVAKGAFAASLRMRGVAGVKMLYEHDPCQPIGRWVDLTEDNHGLLAKGKLLLGVGKAREVYELLKEGVLDGLSIGYRVVKATSARGSESIRTLEEVDLREISTVLFPMNEKAVIGAVKTTDLPSDIALVREFERWLQRDAGFNRSKASQLTAGLNALIKAQRDAGGEAVNAPPAADATALALLRQFTL
jgi:Escherichia/Staphylococcus phage prohead protease